MEGAPTIPTPESKSEKDTSDEKKSKKAERGKEVARLISGAGKEEKREKVAETSAIILDRLIGREKQPEKPTESAKEHPEKPEQGDTRQSSEDIAAEAVADDLASGIRIRHEDLASIPEARDAEVVDRAVEKALANEAEDSATASAESIADESPEERELSVAEEDLASAMSEYTVESDVEEDGKDGAVSVSPVATISGASASAPAASVGNGSGNQPPVPPAPPRMPVSPVPPSSPNAAPQYAANPNAMPAAPQGSPNTYPMPAAANTSPNTTRSVEDAEDLAYRRGRNRGLVAGLVVGGGIEHIRHKRREKKMERKFETERRETATKIENQRWDTIREAEAAKVREAAAARFRSTERPSAAMQPEVSSTARVHSDAEVVRQRAEIQAEIEKKLAAERKETERVVSKAEEIEQERQREQLELAQGHHIERSAWHNIEVDAHGKATQEASFEYGHEYYKERGHETGPKSKQLVDEAAGEVALVAAALSSSSTSTDESAPSTTAHTTGGHSASQDTGQPRSVLHTFTRPPTTAAGTAGWFVALIAIVILYFIVAG